jgi:hypothetical protein
MRIVIDSREQSPSSLPGAGPEPSMPVGASFGSIWSRRGSGMRGSSRRMAVQREILTKEVWKCRD